MKKELSLEEDMLRADKNVERQKAIVEQQECNLLRLQMNKCFIAKNPKVHFALYTENHKVENALHAMLNNKNTDPKGFKVGEEYENV